MPNMEECVEYICDEQKPVLVLDTCVLLDIIRILERVDKKDVAKNQMVNINRILDLGSTESDCSVVVVIPQLVKNEWDDNWLKVLNKVENHLKKIKNHLEVSHVIASSFDSTLPILVHYSEKKLIEDLKNCGERLLTIGLNLELDESICLQAFHRMINRLPPSSPGTINDCIIYLHTLELFKLLRNKSFAKKCVFMSSNTKDYCENGKRIAKEPIWTELETVDAKFITQWHEVLSALGLWSNSSKTH